MYIPECPIPGSPGAYSQFRIQTAEEARQALRSSWSTIEQQYYNLTTRRCTACDGWGYKVYRSRGQLIRESLGCLECQGLGRIPYANDSCGIGSNESCGC